LFTNVEVPCNESGASLQITNCDSVTGDCASNVRKNKTIFIYDLEVKLKWKGKGFGIVLFSTLTGSAGTLGEAEGNGTVTLKDIEATNADDEFEVSWITSLFLVQTVLNWIRRSKSRVMVTTK
jgi:activator of HSP90 ATPase